MEVFSETTIQIKVYTLLSDEYTEADLEEIALRQ